MIDGGNLVRIVHQDFFLLYQLEPKINIDKNESCPREHR